MPLYTGYGGYAIVSPTGQSRQLAGVLLDRLVDTLWKRRRNSPLSHKESISGNTRHFPVLWSSRTHGSILSFRDVFDRDVKPFCGFLIDITKIEVDALAVAVEGGGMAGEVAQFLRAAFHQDDNFAFDKVF